VFGISVEVQNIVISVFYRLPNLLRTNVVTESQISQFYVLTDFFNLSFTLDRTLMKMSLNEP